MPRTSASTVHSKLLGREIRRAREQLGISQAGLAEKMDVSASYLATVEAGRANPTVGQLANIANAMQVALEISFVDPAANAPAAASSSPG